MQIFNQTALEVAWVPGRVNFPKHSLTIIVKGTFHLMGIGDAKFVDEGDKYLIEGDRHLEDDVNKSLEYSSDFAIFKPNADILFRGSCYPPKENKVSGCKVNFGLEGEEQELYIFGDRRWKSSLFGGKKITKPEPFACMRLCYENSYGGEGFSENPVGKGYQSEDLPNIENPKSLIASPKDEPKPICFAPLHALWQERNEKIGTFDQKWESTRWPWYPEDLDWSYFNSAPVSLQRKGFLVGDETLILKNLHPEKSQIKCALPSLRVRCFVNGEHQKVVKKFREVELNLDTLWVDADEEKFTLTAWSNTYCRSIS
jgi:hypothetical protein